MATLYIIGTPIGNMEDMTLRAIRILGEVDVVLAEDTRVTGKLLKRHNINAKFKSYHQQSTDKVATEIINLLEEGNNLALVTDAGMPGIADPGNELIQKIFQALPETEIVSVPGASSLTAALSMSGFPTNEFVFLGFLPHKKGRQTLLNEIAEIDRTIVLFESPHRIGKLLKELKDRVPSRECAIFREITKLHESSYRGTVEGLLGQYEEKVIPEKGEFVVVIAPARM